MNDKCAAGTGRFLEMTASVWVVMFPNFLHLASKSTRRMFNSTCVVFANRK